MLTWEGSWPNSLVRRPPWLHACSVKNKQPLPSNFLVLVFMILEYVLILWTRYSFYWKTLLVNWLRTKQATQWCSLKHCCPVLIYLQAYWLLETLQTLFYLHQILNLTWFYFNTEAIFHLFVTGQKPNKMHHCETLFKIQALLRKQGSSQDKKGQKTLNFLKWQTTKK